MNDSGLVKLLKKIFKLEKLLETDEKNFATSFGLIGRKFIAPILRPIFASQTSAKIVVESYPNLKWWEWLRPHIFCSTHYHPEDIIGNMASLKGISTWALMGSIDQIKNNPKMIGAFFNGMMCVDRANEKSRKDSILKMLRVIKYKNSVLIYAEGGWNNTENLLCQRLFGGPYYLSKMTSKKVIPMSNFYSPETNTMYIRFGEPLDLSKYEKNEGLDILRDNMASMMFEQIKAYSAPLKRDELKGDLHKQHMENRLAEYCRGQSWTSNEAIADELVVYKPSSITTIDDVLEDLKNVKITRENYSVMKHFIEDIESLGKYDLKKFILSQERSYEEKDVIKNNNTDVESVTHNKQNIKRRVRTSKHRG